MELTLIRLPSQLEMENETWIWLPFACTVGIFVLAFHGLAYSLFPWLVPQKLHIWNAAASTDSLTFILIGVAVVLPLILLWTAFSYRVFWGKARDLGYD
jgi:cytochrome d ubiquinol oxidase subunit II